MALSRLVQALWGRNVGTGGIWISDQPPDEVLLIKIFDSEGAEGGVTKTPHASLEMDCSEEEPPPRESIEVRAVLCF
ncbi:hypothetical protein GJ744_009117 [Endocarpon pusillum]|uniref:Uncharacterized protein n=1 Tax=Endocarpon pusillum TaxID=364733 RepID=A0A8H7AGI0_9EURO|nr:hypothetical protein GJ744_009117 [Endocarpon pusillum]